MSRAMEINQIKSWLMRRRETLRRQLADEISRLGTDEDEESLDDEEYVVMAQSESKELALLNDALLRFHAGNYGICEACEIEIPLVRLKAIPCATHCIECQRAAETGQQPASPAPTKLSSDGEMSYQTQ